MILVTCGTTKHPFARMDRLVQNLMNTFREEIVYQNLATKLESKDQLKVVGELEYTAFVSLIQQASIIITHGGPATIYLAWEAGKIPYVLSRQKRYHEHVDDHQVYFAKYLEKNKKIRLLHKSIIDEIVKNEEITNKQNNTLFKLTQRLTIYVSNS